MKGGPKLRGDFFAFEPKLRNGSYVAVGDFDGDGLAELFAGAGPGGGPRVTIFSGSALLQNQEVRLRDFFAGDITNRGGIRVAVKNLDNDKFAEWSSVRGPAGAVSLLLILRWESRILAILRHSILLMHSQVLTVVSLSVERLTGSVPNLSLNWL